MTARRCLIPLALVAGLSAQSDKDRPQFKDRKADDSKAQPQEQEPPEEDESQKPKEYSFNPLEAEKDVRVGSYYYKRGNYKAAMSRFLEATKWNPSYAEAFLRLGESEEKLKDRKAAGVAYAKYLELAPDAKDADVIKKKLAGKR